MFNGLLPSLLWTVGRFSPGSVVVNERCSGSLRAPETLAHVLRLNGLDRAPPYSTTLKLPNLKSPNYAAALTSCTFGCIVTVSATHFGAGVARRHRTPQKYCACLL